MGDSGGPEWLLASSILSAYCLVGIGDLKVAPVSQQVRHGQQWNTTISALLFAGFAHLGRRRHQSLLRYSRTATK